uniref:Geminin n=1 Tax=Phallusia mammillata TaxID=59560 RepID=A0A6F9DDP5_9ASCI|nr:geminin [Phallusia mammillata]
MLSTKMLLSHLDRNSSVDENGKGPKQSTTINKTKKRVLQAKSTNVKANISQSNSKGSIKDFFADIPNVHCERKRKLVIFDENAQTAKKSKTISTQTSPDVVDLTCSETPSDKYWELLAEERRKALHEALDENKQLADEIEKKDEIIKDLKTEVESLGETASQAEYLASVIEQLGEDCLNTDDLKSTPKKHENPDLEDELAITCENSPSDEESKNLDTNLPTTSQQDNNLDKTCSLSSNPNENCNSKDNEAFDQIDTSCLDSQKQKSLDIKHNDDTISGIVNEEHDENDKENSAPATPQS